MTLYGILGVLLFTIGAAGTILWLFTRWDT